MLGRPVANRASLIAASDGFGPGIAEERLHAALDRDDRRNLLRQPHLQLVIEVGARHVKEPPGLVGNRLDDVRMRMAGRIDGNPGGAVEEHVAVHVLDGRAGGVIDHQRIPAGVRRGDHFRVPRDERRGLRPRERGLDHGRFHESEI